MSILNLFGNKKLIIALTIIAIVIIIIVLVPKQEQTPTSTNPNDIPAKTIVETIDENQSLKGLDQGQKSISKTNIVRANLPSTASIYSYKKEPVLSDEGMRTLINYFDLSIRNEVQSPNSGKIIIASDATNSLIIKPDIGVFEYSKNSYGTEQTFAADTSADSYLQNIVGELNKMGISTTKYKTSNYVLWENQEEHPNIVNTFAEAGFIEIILKATIDEHPIIDKKGTTTANYISIQMKPDYSINKIYFEDVGVITSRKETVNIKNADEIVQAFDNGEAKLIYVDGVVLTDIFSTTISNIEIGYVPAGNELHPVFILSGVTRTIDNQSWPGWMILDAKK